MQTFKENKCIELCNSFTSEIHYFSIEKMHHPIHLQVDNWMPERLATVAINSEWLEPDGQWSLNLGSLDRHWLFVEKLPAIKMTKMVGSAANLTANPISKLEP